LTFATYALHVFGLSSHCLDIHTILYGSKHLRKSVYQQKNNYKHNIMKREDCSVSAVNTKMFLSEKLRYNMCSAFDRGLRKSIVIFIFIDNIKTCDVIIFHAFTENCQPARNHTIRSKNS